jgi:hypothetical protein
VQSKLIGSLSNSNNTGWIFNFALYKTSIKKKKSRVTISQVIYYFK